MATPSGMDDMPALAMAKFAAARRTENMLVKAFNEAKAADKAVKTAEAASKTAKTACEVSKKAKAANLLPGSYVRTPSTHPSDFSKNSRGLYINKYTGEIFEKSHTNHSHSTDGEWKIGAKPGVPPTKTKKTTVSYNGEVIKHDK